MGKVLLYSKLYFATLKTKNVKSKGMKEKVFVMGAWCGKKNPHSGSLFYITGQAL